MKEVVVAAVFMFEINSRSLYEVNIISNKLTYYK